MAQVYINVNSDYQNIKDIQNPQMEDDIEYFFKSQYELAIIVDEETKPEANATATLINRNDVVNGITNSRDIWIKSLNSEEIKIPLIKKE